MVDDWDYLRTYGCVSAGCTHEAYAARGLHAPNCTQAEIDYLLALNDRLQAAVDEFLAFEDDHREGPVVDDSYVKGPVCADENCGRYWPCPVEELRRAVT